MSPLISYLNMIGISIPRDLHHIEGPSADARSHVAAPAAYLDIEAQASIFFLQPFDLLTLLEGIEMHPAALPHDLADHG